MGEEPLSAAYVEDRRARLQTSHSEKTGYIRSVDPFAIGEVVLCSIEFVIGLGYFHKWGIVYSSDFRADSICSPRVERGNGELPAREIGAARRLSLRAAFRTVLLRPLRIAFVPLPKIV
jgi:hypothetical protein